MLAGDQLDHLLDVVQRALVAGEVAAWAAAAAGSAAVGARDGDALVVEVGGGLPEPAGVAGDAVQEDDNRPRRRRPARPMEVVQPDAVVDREEAALGAPAGQRARRWVSACHGVVVGRAALDRTPRASQPGGEGNRIGARRRRLGHA